MLLLLLIPIAIILYVILRNIERKKATGAERRRAADADQRRIALEAERHLLETREAAERARWRAQREARRD